MALEKAVVPISLAGGVDTKNDPKQVIPGKLLLLENAKFQTGHELRKVPGDAPLSTSIIGGGNISNAVQIAAFKDELVLNDGALLYSYGADEQSWVNKGQTFTVSMESFPVVRDNYAQVDQDSATHPSGLQAFAWEDSQGGVRYSIIDMATKLQIVANQPFLATGNTPKVVAIGNYLLIFCYDTTGTRLIYRAINTANPQTLGPIVQIESDVNVTHPNFDVVVINARVFFVYNNNGGGISFGFVDQFLVQSATHTVAGEVASGCITGFGDASNNFWVAYYDGTDVKYFIYNYSLSTQVLAPTILEATVFATRNITGVVQGTTGTFFYEQPRSSSASEPYFSIIRTNTGTITGTVGTSSVLIRSLGLGSKAFVYGANIFLLGSYIGPLQPTYFLINQNGVVAAKLSPLTGGGLTVKPGLPQVNNIAPGEYQFSYLQQDFFATQSGQDFFLTGVMQATLDLNPLNLISVDIGQGLQTNGGFLSMYDGISSVELGYHLFPEKPEINIVFSGGGLGPGQYQYSLVYAWTDNFGQIHRSAPSIAETFTLPPTNTPVTFTASFGVGNSSMTVSSTTGLFVGQVITDTTTPANILPGTYITRISGLTVDVSSLFQGTAAGDTLQTIDTFKTNLELPTLRITAKKPPLRSNVWIEVYRTEANGTIFYLVSSISNPVYNDTTVDLVPFTDTSPDNAIIGNIQLYTTGGVVENISPPAAKLIWQYQNRLILVPYEAPNTWWYSKEIIPGSPLEFSDSFVNNMDQRGGPITAGSQMDSEIVFFKGPTDVFYVTGQGPSSNGLNNDFSQPQIVPTGAGCVDPNSVVTMPNGLLYKSEKGYYLLGRNFEAKYIGAEVEAFNSANCTSSQLLINDNEVRLTLDNNIMLLYDYYYGQWSTIPNVSAVSSAFFQNQFCYVQSNGLVLQEDPNIWTHNGNVRRIKFTTSWLSMAALQGFQRVYKMLVLGTYLSPHKLKLNVAINFNPNYIQEEYINATNLLSNPAYGIDSPYGAGTPYGGQDQTYQWRIYMSKQKCQAVQFTLEEIPMMPYGEGVAFSALTLELGGKKGVFKVAADKSF